MRTSLLVPTPQYSSALFDYIRCPSEGWHMYICAVLQASVGYYQFKVTRYFSEKFNGAEVNTEARIPNINVVCWTWLSTH